MTLNSRQAVINYQLRRANVRPRGAPIPLLERANKLNYFTQLTSKLQSSLLQDVELSKSLTCSNRPRDPPGEGSAGVVLNVMEVRQRPSCAAQQVGQGTALSTPCSLHPSKVFAAGPWRKKHLELDRLVMWPRMTLQRALRHTGIFPGFIYFSRGSFKNESLYY